MIFFLRAAVLMMAAAIPDAVEAATGKWGYSGEDGKKDSRIRSRAYHRLVAKFFRKSNWAENLR